MKVFITGATGYIGGAVAAAAARAGHDVIALAHTDSALQSLRARGWHAVAGDLRDGEGLERRARQSDAVIHAANTGGPDAAEVDTAATRSFLRALGHTGKSFVYTSGVWVLGAGRSDEDTRPDPAALIAWRAPLEAEIVTAAPGIRSVVVRPGIVFGRGGGIPGMIARGEVPVIGTGAQRWPLVHVDDLADLYVRALHAAPGTILHGVATTVTMREMALLSRHDQSGIETKSVDDARAALGAFADALALDQDVDSTRTRIVMQWRPRRLSVIEELLTPSREAA